MNFFHRLKYLFSSEPPAQETEGMDLRSDRNEGARPITVAELHAVLTEALNQGLGQTPVEIPLEFVEGQLCGAPASTLQTASIGPNHWQMRKDGLAVQLRPSRGLLHISGASFRAWYRLDRVLGPHS